MGFEKVCDFTMNFSIRSIDDKISYRLFGYHVTQNDANWSRIITKPQAWSDGRTFAKWATYFLIWHQRYLLSVDEKYDRESSVDVFRHCALLSGWDIKCWTQQNVFYTMTPQFRKPTIQFRSEDNSLYLLGEVNSAEWFYWCVLQFCKVVMNEHTRKYVNTDLKSRPAVSQKAATCFPIWHHRYLLSVVENRAVWTGSLCFDIVHCSGYETSSVERSRMYSTWWRRSFANQQFNFVLETTVCIRSEK